MKNLKALTCLGVFTLMLLFSDSLTSQNTYTISDPEDLTFLSETLAAGGYGVTTFTRTIF